MSGGRPTVVRVAVPVPLHGLFDYAPPVDGNPPSPGARVVVPFGRRRLVGVVIERADSTTFDPDRLKPVLQVLDDALLDREHLDLLRWTTRYYASPPGELVTHALPVALRRPEPFRRAGPAWLHLTDAGRAVDLARAPRQAEVVEALTDGPQRRDALQAAGHPADALRRMLEQGRIETCDAPAREPVPGPTLNPEQRVAVAAVLAARHRFEAFVLAGVTGSGKTEVYLQAARALVRRGRQVLLLLPEIGLTPQLVRRVEARLGFAAHVYHSGLSDGERVATWEAAHSGEARVLIGTRSAVFLPLRNPGLIVVDEEHDSSFKQFDGMRYHGRDVAVLRASRLGIPIVLGSATPSLESLQNVHDGRYRLLDLPRRAGGAVMPRWRIEDLRGATRREGLTEALVERIRRRLEAGEQVLVYRNRRGFAPVLMCDECGWQADCSRCSAHLTWHRQAARLSCHHCGQQRPVPPRCPECDSPRLAAAGSGTERIEHALNERFPDVPVLRVDRDSMRGRDEFEQLLEQVGRGDPCILVGTQMLAKGHHLPGIGLAVVLDADTSLFSADFRAPERLAQTVFQVAGRAGRRDPGEFVLQTRHPEHALVQAMAAGSYLKLAELLRAERAAAELPPAWSLAMVRAEAQSADRARAFLARVAGTVGSNEVRLAGPLPALLQRRAGHWRYQLWLMAPERAPIQRTVARLLDTIPADRDAARVRWHVDVDPLEL
ncbi:primosomal protein N' [Wenzhouxiangella sp. XN79A]|uniref:primosomal protein N' n=1 Tax=Wenzhouxiangella sp. XN79A TaxID=2724193 RepID=UPI00144A939C|nr:primosomal protein N' [Wenzhouxiangella sp. XN79A]